jgi:phospholipid/cholesterol/gamma-HCH transport system substrate-binding protein
MREVTVEVTVGVVMFMIMLALGVFTIILSRENIFKTYYPIKVHFRSVGGLSNGDNVLYHGVNIGVVKSLEIETNGIIVEANLEYPVTFYEDYRISIDSSSVLGGHNLSIQEGTHDKPVVGRDQLLKGELSISLIEDASKTFAMVKKALGEGGILKNLEDAMANIKDVSADLKPVGKNLAEGKGTLGKLMTDDTMYNRFDDIAANLDKVSKELASGQGTLGKLIGSDELYNEVMGISADVKEISGQLAQGKGTLGKLMADDSLYNEISAVSSNLAVVTDRLVEGDGTLGKLSKDPELYDEIKVLVEEAIATLDDLRETTPITSFSSIFFGAF